MRLRSILASCAVIAAVPVAVSAQTAQKIAYVNSAMLMQSAPGRAEAEAQFAKEMAPVEAQMKRLQDSVVALNEAFAKEEATLAGAAKEARLKVLRDKEAGFELEAGKLREQAQDRQEALMAPIMESLRKALEDVRTEGGYAMIFDVAVQMSYIVAADKNLDVTDRVLAKLRLSAPKAVAPAAAKPAAGPASTPAGVTTKKPPAE